MTMAELRARFRSLDRIAAPDVWADVEERSAAVAPKPLTAIGGPLIRFDLVRLPQYRRVRLLLALGLLVIALIALSLIFGGTRTPGPPRLVFSASPTGEGTTRVYAINPADATAVPIFEGSAQRVHVSPDGRHAFFAGVSNALSGLVMARTDGSARRALADPGEPEIGRVWESIWASDSHAVAWTSWRENQPTLMVADAEAGDARPIAVPPDPNPQLGWASDSVHIAWVGSTACDSTNARITSIVDSVAGRVLALRQDLDGHGLPVWAHHGGRLAGLVAPPDPNSSPGTVTCGVRMGPPQLEIWDIASDTIRAIPLDVYVGNIAWSADDRAIWAISDVSGRARSLWRIDVETGGISEVARLEDALMVVWAHDPTRLAWTVPAAGAGDVADLWSIDLPGGRPHRIARNVGQSGPDGWPKWSPTDEWIAFHRGPYDVQPGGWHGSIWVVRPDGSDERLLVDARSGVDLINVDW